MAVGVCWFIAYWLRFNLSLPEPFLSSASQTVLFVLCAHAPAFWLFGLYRGIWRYASLMDLRRIIIAVSFASVGVAAAVYMLRTPVVPRSVFVLHPVLLVLVMGGSRFAYRAWKDRALYGRLSLNGEPVLLLGTGDAAERLLRELDNSPDWHVVGLLTDLPRRVGQELRGRKIIGTISEVVTWAEKLEVSRVIVAMPESSQLDRGHAIENSVQAGLTVLTVPSLDDMLAGKVAISQIRKVQLEDLLGREPVQLDNCGLFEWLGGQVVLVTGAGGSIGSELVRQIAQFKPGMLLLLDISEFSLYQIEQEFLRQYSGVQIACVVGDVKDAGFLERVFCNYAPSVVFHLSLIHI